ncbi:UNVERIFIED_CONTAM: Retrovirus-related Pol polyprotein from transposon RE2, partial [Sesamum indicum]
MLDDLIQNEFVNFEHASETYQNYENRDSADNSLEEGNEDVNHRPNETLRRSSRLRVRPIKFQDFICSSSLNSSNLLTITHSHSMHTCLLTASQLPQTPRTYAHAANKREWSKNYRQQMDFKIKVKPDGSMERYKVRLVAKGYNQIESPSKQVLKEIKQYLDRLFTIKDLGTARFFLDLEIARSNEGITVTQTKYIRDIVIDAGLMQAKPTSTPLPAGCKVTVSKEEQMLDPESYRRLLGRLMYLGFTRPDICYGTQQLSQFKQHPCKEHWNATLYL